MRRPGSGHVDSALWHVRAAQQHKLGPLSCYADIWDAVMRAHVCRVNPRTSLNSSNATFARMPDRKDRYDCFALVKGKEGARALSENSMAAIVLPGFTNRVDHYTLPGIALSFFSLPFAFLACCPAKPLIYRLQKEEAAALQVPA